MSLQFYQREEQPTRLDLPRILMFHGGGTNSTIFKLQCRAITRQLRSVFRFVFVEGPFISAQPGPDVVRVFKDMGPYKSWLRWKEKDVLRTHLEGLERIEDAIRDAMIQDDMRGATGEWVGVLGFSQGAKLCASILATQQYRQEVFGEAPTIPNFRFGVLLAGRGPLVWMDEHPNIPRGMVDAAALSSSDYEWLPNVLPEHRLHIPTLHVHGMQDPGLDLHQKMTVRNFDPTSVRLMEWEGSHMVPIKTVDVNRLVQEIIILATSTGVIGPI